jgi:hypothetical protein
MDHVVPEKYRAVYDEISNKVMNPLTSIVFSSALIERIFSRFADIWTKKCHRRSLELANNMVRVQLHIQGEMEDLRVLMRKSYGAALASAAAEAAAANAAAAAAADADAAVPAAAAAAAPAAPAPAEAVDLPVIPSVDEEAAVLSVRSADLLVDDFDEEVFPDAEVVVLGEPGAAVPVHQAPLAPRPAQVRQRADDAGVDERPSQELVELLKAYPPHLHHIIHALNSNDRRSARIRDREINKEVRRIEAAMRRENHHAVDGSRSVIMGVSAEGAAVELAWCEEDEVLPGAAAPAVDPMEAPPVRVVVGHHVEDEDFNMDEMEEE